MEKERFLQSLGLGIKESRIYMALLQEGPATISDLSRRTGLYRPALYKTLPGLVGRGLVTISPSGSRRKYVAESPQKLRAIYASSIEESGAVLDEMERTWENEDARPLVKYFEGRKGISFIFSDIVHTLKRGDVFYRYTSAEDWEKNKGYLPPEYRPIREQKQLQRFVIGSEIIKKRKPNLNRAVKAIPAAYDLFQYDITQIIYSDKVAFIDYGSEAAFIVENAKIAAFQKSLFKLLYDKLPGAAQ